MKRVLLPAVFGAVVFFAGATGVASADQDVFLCPIVGDGVINADSVNGDNGVAVIGPDAGTSLLPGNNQAGPNANDSAYNGGGGPSFGNNPGHNPDYTPIWNP